MAHRLEPRVEKIEVRTAPSRTYAGVSLTGWTGPQDDEALALARVQAEAKGEMLIILCPPGFEYHADDAGGAD